MPLFDDVIAVLRTRVNSIMGTPLSLATENVKETMGSLIEAANLPPWITQRYIDFADEEDLLYTSSLYRDHFFHPFHTFMLGFKIMKELRNLEVEQPPIPINDDFLRKWILTSFWHDVTYAVQDGPEILKGFIRERLGFKVNADCGVAPLLGDEKYNKAIDILSRQFRNQHNRETRTFRSWLQNQLIEYNDHAVLSALLLISDENNLRPRNLYVESALAIALHNFHKSFASGNLIAQQLGPLKITDSELSFLLAFCDSVQIWGRPKRGEPSDLVEIDRQPVRIYPDPAVQEIEICLNFGEEDVMRVHGRELADLQRSWRCSVNPGRWLFHVRQGSINNAFVPRIPSCCT